MGAIAIQATTPAFAIVNGEWTRGLTTGNALGVWHFGGRKQPGGR